MYEMHGQGQESKASGLHGPPGLPSDQRLKVLLDRHPRLGPWELLCGRAVLMQSDDATADKRLGFPGQLHKHATGALEASPHPCSCSRSPAPLQCTIIHQASLSLATEQTPVCPHVPLQAVGAGSKHSAPDTV